MTDPGHHAPEEASQIPSANGFRNWRTWMPKAIFEAGLIVFGLVLTLGLTSWQEQRSLERDVAETREAIIAEVEANREMLRSDYIMPHHRAMQQGLSQALMTADTADDLRDGALSLFETGIHLPQFRDAAWRTASSSGVLQHMERSEVFALADVYGAQDRLSQSVMAYYPSALALPGQIGDVDRLRGALIGTGLFLGDLYGGEQAIVHLQTEALQTMGAEPATAAPPEGEAAERPA